MNISDIRMLFDYTIWANHLTLDAVEQLSIEDQQRNVHISHNSIYGTLVHMLFAEWVWLARWKGVSPSAPLRVEDFPDVEAIRQRWRQLETERAEFMATLTEESLQANLTYRDIKGNEYSNPLVLLMQHVVNHATLHRGQIVGLIRQLGITPPATDFLFYFRK